MFYSPLLILSPNASALLSYRGIGGSPAGRSYIFSAIVRRSHFFTRIFASSAVAHRGRLLGTYRSAIRGKAMHRGAKDTETTQMIITNFSRIPMHRYRAAAKTPNIVNLLKLKQYGHKGGECLRIAMQAVR